MFYFLFYSNFATFLRLVLIKSCLQKKNTKQLLEILKKWTGEGCNLIMKTVGIRPISSQNFHYCKYNHQIKKEAALPFLVKDCTEGNYKIKSNTIALRLWSWVVALLANSSSQRSLPILLYTIDLIAVSCAVEYKCDVNVMLYLLISVCQYSRPEFFFQLYSVAYCVCNKMGKKFNFWYLLAFLLTVFTLWLNLQRQRVSEIQVTRVKFNDGPMKTPEYLVSNSLYTSC